MYDSLIHIVSLLGYEVSEWLSISQIARRLRKACPVHEWTSCCRQDTGMHVSSSHKFAPFGCHCSTFIVSRTSRERRKDIFCKWFSDRYRNLKRLQRVRDWLVSWQCTALIKGERGIATGRGIDAQGKYRGRKYRPRKYRCSEEPTLFLLHGTV